MSNIVDKSLFTGEYLIPNTVTGSATESALLAAITIYEKEILIKLLGRSLYDLFIAGLAAGSPLAKWTDLRDGKDMTFTVNGYMVTVHFEGVKKLIVPYVYYYYRRNEATMTGGMFDVSAKAENGTAISPYLKMVNAWNRLIELYGDLPDWWITPDEINSYEHYDDLPTAYNFLLVNKADYTGWKYTPLQHINEFGI